jgi:hypothetical protein
MWWDSDLADFVIGLDQLRPFVCSLEKRWDHVTLALYSTSSVLYTSVVISHCICIHRVRVMSEYKTYGMCTLKSLSLCNGKRLLLGAHITVCSIGPFHIVGGTRGYSLLPRSIVLGGVHVPSTDLEIFLPLRIFLASGLIVPPHSHLFKLVGWACSVFW